MIHQAPALGRNSSGVKSLTRDVQQTLLGWIRDGKYPPGTQLPSVQDLVRQLRVSRTVFREALQALAGMNLIDMRPGLGCFVKTISSDLVVNAEVMASLLDREAIAEVAVARRLIEVAIARLAALTATEEDFEELEEVLRKIERAARKNQPMYSITPLFHVAVARATHNKVLEKIVSSFNLLMASGGALIERQNVWVSLSHSGIRIAPPLIRSIAIARSRSGSTHHGRAHHRDRKLTANGFEQSMGNRC